MAITNKEITHKFRLAVIIKHMVLLFICSNINYTRQQMKVYIPLWRSLKDLIFIVQNSNWYHFEACPIVFIMMGKALFSF